MKELRKLGNKLKLQAIEKGLTTSDIATQLNMSEHDLLRVYAGRVLLTFSNLKKLSDILEITVTDLLNTPDDEYYATILDHPMKVTNNSNIDKILDIIDDYLDVYEAIS